MDLKRLKQGPAYHAPIIILFLALLLLPGCSKGSPRGQIVWEYQTIDEDYLAYQGKDERRFYLINGSPVLTRDQLLKEMGALGWELVSCDKTLTFKRQSGQGKATAMQKASRSRFE